MVKFKRFFINTLIIFVVAIAISQALFSTIFETYHFPCRIIGIGFVWSVTCMSHFWIMKTVINRPSAFGRVFMVQTIAKLMLYMVCIAGYLFFYRQYAIPFTMHFLAVYLIFAVFEVASILKFVGNSTGQAPGCIKKSNGFS